MAGNLKVYDGANWKYVSQGEKGDTGSGATGTSGATGATPSFASVAETTAGSSTSKAVTPAGLKGSIFGERIVNIALNGTIALTTSEKGKFRIPASMNGMNLVSVAANCGLDGLSGSSSSGTPTFTVQKGTTDMLSTNITIDQGEYDTTTAATPAVIKGDGSQTVATDNIIMVECTVAGVGVTYVLITLEFALP